jgi:hypothetical protein
MAPLRHPPAWYPDPAQPGRLRRWNGRAWTEEVRPIPAWLHTVRLAPGPTARVPRPSRRLWATSALLLALGAVLMLALDRSSGPDLDRVDDRRFTSAADRLCASTGRSLPERDATRGSEAELGRIETRTVLWDEMVQDLRALPVAGADTAKVDRWLDEWDRWTALRQDYVTARRDGDEVEATRLLEQAQVPHAAVVRFALVNGMNSCVF